MWHCACIVCYGCVFNVYTIFLCATTYTWCVYHTKIHSQRYVSDCYCVRVPPTTKPILTQMDFLMLCQCVLSSGLPFHSCPLSLKSFCLVLFAVETTKCMWCERGDRGKRKEKTDKIKQIIITTRTYRFVSFFTLYEWNHAVLISVIGDFILSDRSDKWIRFCWPNSMNLAIQGYDFPLIFIKFCQFSPHKKSEKRKKKKPFYRLRVSLCADHRFWMARKKTVL